MVLLARISARRVSRILSEQPGGLWSLNGSDVPDSVWRSDAYKAAVAAQLDGLFGVHSAARITSAIADFNAVLST